MPKQTEEEKRARYEAYQKAIVLVSDVPLHVMNYV